MENKLAKKKRHNFVRYNSEYLNKLGSNWRKPKGMHNKTRLSKKGHPLLVSIGYGNQKQSKGMYKSQFHYKLINSENDLENLKEKYIMISGNLGLRSKILLLNKVKVLNVNVLNVKDIEKFIKDAEEKIKINKQKKKLKEHKKQEVKKKVEEASKKTKEITEEEKTEKDKEEKRKILEKGL